MTDITVHIAIREDAWRYHHHHHHYHPDAVKEELVNQGFPDNDPCNLFVLAEYRKAYPKDAEVTGYAAKSFRGCCSETSVFETLDAVPNRGAPAQQRFKELAESYLSGNPSDNLLAIVSNTACSELTQRIFQELGCETLPIE
jgi:hypothetical protein